MLGRTVFDISAVFKPPSERTRFTVVPIVARSIALLVNLTVLILSLRERLFRRDAVRLAVAVTLILAGFFAEYTATLHDFFVGPVNYLTKFECSFFLQSEHFSLWASKWHMKIFYRFYHGCLHGFVCML